IVCLAEFSPAERCGMASEHPVAIKRARIVATSPTKLGGRFWYQLVVIDGPVTPGTILRQTDVTHDPRVGARHSPAQDPEDRQPAINRLRAWADANGWAIDSDSGPSQMADRGEKSESAAISLAPRAIPSDHERPSPRRARIVESRVSRYGSCTRVMD